MAEPLLTWDGLQATWTELAASARATITAALVAEVDAELRRLDAFYPASPGAPTVQVLGVLTNPAGVRRVHFIASELNYNSAQSGSDGADHYVFVGTAVLDGETLGAIILTTAVQSTIREYDWEDYRSAPVVEQVRDQTLAALGAMPPQPEMERITIVRCPSCGATDAEATEFIFEITRMSCGVCGHSELCDEEQIKDEWNVKHDRRKGEPSLPRFVPPQPSTKPGFELRGEVPAETRMLVHPGIGYAIAMPGGPLPCGPVGAQSVILQLGAWVDVVVRTQRFWSMTTCDGLLRRELEGAAQRRAQRGSALELVQAPLPPGATASMYVTYPRRVDDEDRTELLVLTLEGEHPNYDAVFLYVSYRRKLDPFAWANLRAALFAHQTWMAGELPALVVWPEGGAFSEPTLSLGSTRRGSDEAEAKAEVLGAMTNADAQRVTELLLSAASTFDAPATPWTTADTERISHALIEGVGAELAQVLVRDLAAVQSMHDFRAWCRCCQWAVDNRGRKRRNR
ncbi:MAG: hypothetical protein H0T79_02640 [Deltaproteobacteria bacterium]|nr:hypothetical protein [Deltaproteobacteria bacterium]